MVVRWWMFAVVSDLVYVQYILIKGAIDVYRRTNLLKRFFGLDNLMVFTNRFIEIPKVEAISDCEQGDAEHLNNTYLPVCMSVCVCN